MLIKKTTWNFIFENCLNTSMKPRMWVDGE